MPLVEGAAELLTTGAQGSLRAPFGGMWPSLLQLANSRYARAPRFWRIKVQRYTFSMMKGFSLFWCGSHAEHIFFLTNSIVFLRRY